MNEVCGDNRFEIINAAKEKLLTATNIESDKAEMAVLDRFLFRCWQMGWLEPERTCNNIGKKDCAGFTTFECSECGEHFPAGEAMKATGYCSYWNYCPNCGAKVVE